MTARLSSYKRLLTQYLNKVETVVSRFKSEQLEIIKWEEQDLSTSFVTNSRRRLEEGLGAIEAYISKIESLLRDYASLLDETENLPTKEKTDFENYSIRAESVMCNAVDYTVLLHARLRAVRSDQIQNRQSSENQLESLTKPTKVDLPTLPIPSFSGNIWEWDNFWSLFDANVHSQAIPDFYKFNYLLKALKGNAYNAIRKFQVSAENYQRAVEFLRKKYGSSEELINNLIDRMESLTMRSHSLKDQRTLLEQLQVITEQLKMKGEHVDNQWFIKQVLGKFTIDIQRRVLEKKQTLNQAEAFDMKTLFKLLDEVISNEEIMALYTKKPSQAPELRTEKKEKLADHRLRVQCMYCGGEHKSLVCTKYKTAQERSRYLRDHNLCLICASPKHSTKECKKRMCFTCQGAHHTSCCFKASTESDRSATQPARQDSHKKSNSSGIKKGQVPPSAGKVCNVMKDESSHQATSVAETRISQDNFHSVVFLPTGEVTAMNLSTRELKKISVLLDTGAELSFIEEALAEELGLPTLEEKKIRLRTFGSELVQERTCREVALEVWDNDGRPITLRLLTSAILTKSFSPPPMLEQDVEFMNFLNLTVNWKRNAAPTAPQVLLGCDQLWPLIRDHEPHIRLPSGLNIVPSRLGHLITGRIDQPEKLEREAQEEPMGNWEAINSNNTHVHTVVVQGFKDEEELTEEEMFTRFCTLESSGSEEFSMNENEARSEIDKQVWDDFIKTVERRKDGYYVRLPWKIHNVQLPDNKAIAYRRLLSLWKSLQKNEELLEQYNKVFQEQLSGNIIEKVDEGQRNGSKHIHYIPHQMVLTPHKTTTKLRIVFDASAHFSDCPSLNDMLHRGPVILPKLFGLLLRLRVGRVALIADVEKAFLQIRLHEDDRDVTRCLWLRNHKLPPNKENIQVYRFTRITFGLLSSPFLLAATTHYHLDQYKNEKLASQIKENLYVDNLIITMDTKQEAITAYRRSKEMFGEMQMNLREFVSNDPTVLEEMENKDKSTGTIPKVLGIKWASTVDMLQISCCIPNSGKNTKRTVASAIASVYDPMGWLAPLMHKAKRFLQTLWKDEYEWDATLHQVKEFEWTNICADIDGFQTTIPRCLARKSSKAAILTYADASTEAIAACTYLQAEGVRNLLMAKSKLPPLKVKTTMPKMELNAMTLAFRLTNAVLQQIGTSIEIEDVAIFSDSEIALSWVTTKLRHDVGPFVRNRVLEVHRITKHLKDQGYTIKMGHIASSSNPADCATRGLSKEALSGHFWWSGPSLDIEVKWYSFMTESNETLEDEKEGEGQRCFTISRIQDPEDIFMKLQRFSISEIKRVVAYVVRFITMLAMRANQSLKTPLGISPIFKEQKPADSITLKGSEITVAEKVIVKQHQISQVTEQILHSLSNLNIRPDQYGILRCYGRLGKSCLDESTKFPMLVLQNTWLSKSIIEAYHKQGHTGVSHTMAKVRERYWIPKLRAQVTKIVRSCVTCQRFNNLPFKYPEQGDLPSRRVRKCRPFAHVGLDYFGPLQVAVDNGDLGKAYGCIITCLVTRLIHLDIVNDLSTAAFIRMLRRFFSRRGTPQTITCDNSPTFNLGESILAEAFERAKMDENLTRIISDKEIQWKYISPYAPWQGGVYERLIKSVKMALFKAIGKATLPYEELLTITIEIEALLNTRPLTYVESDGVIDRILRPIDFLQDEFECPIPMDTLIEEYGDPTYKTSEERQAFRTRLEVIKAQQSSCKLTERFWVLWKTQYLTSLRESHQKEAVKQRGSRYTPEVGKLVLINDAMQPRHTWKIGRIEELKQNAEGIIREAVIMLPSRRTIRRTLNLLTPLEIDDKSIEHQEQQEKKPKDTEPREEPATTSRYALRPRKPINYEESDACVARVNSLALLTILALSLVTSGTSFKIDPTQFSNSSKYFLRCIQGGVELISPDGEPYEICAENFCKTFWNPRIDERVKFPAVIILHEHEVQWKLLRGSSLKTVETVCPPAPFCENIDCTICATLVFNPECWPLGAIIVTALMIYFFLTGCYVFLYVPLVVGQPFRALANGLLLITKTIFRNIRRRRPERSRYRNSNSDIAVLLTIAGILATSTIEGCQMMDVFLHQSQICTNSQDHNCKIQVSNVLKINPFRREACLKLMKNETTVHEIRVLWMNLLLTCESDTEMFTRDAVFNVVDSKRCPHTGSCIGEKCARINSSSVIPELQEGNQYPGVTTCVESCGGPGCDCFYWSSGCLFYRIYLKPSSQQIYEIFKCTRWRESAKVKVIHVDTLNKRTRSYIMDMQPNIPIKLDAMTFTLSSVTTPPLPVLSSKFISDGIDIALWSSEIVPSLHCTSKTAAQNLSCEVVDKCTCYPAETKANCKCTNVNISDWLQNVEHRLPVILSSVTFKRSTGGVQALVSTMTTAEIILNLDELVLTRVVIEDIVCSVESATITGCYNCAKGAQSQVRCFSSKPSQAEIQCGQFSFSVSCDENGVESVLRFSLSNARVHIVCSVSCGRQSSTFEVTGVLKFTHTARMVVSSWISGNGESISEIQWPDIWHIADVFMQCISPEADEDTTALALLYHDGYPNEDQAEMDLTKVLHSLHQQVDAATILTIQWNHVRQHGTTSNTPENHARQVGDCLRNAMVTKEKILRLGTRYILSDLLYDRAALMGTLSKWRRGQWVNSKLIYDVRGSEVLVMVDAQMNMLNQCIREMEESARDAEQPTSSNQFPLTYSTVLEMVRQELRRRDAAVDPNASLSELKERLRVREVEMVQLIEKIDSLEQTSQTQEEPEREVDANEEGGSSFLEVQAEGSKGNQVSPGNSDDCDYFLRMIQEVAERESPPMDPPRKRPRETLRQENEEENALRRQINQMLYDINFFPSRRLGESSYGIEPWIRCAFCNAIAQHYSDSCPQVPYADDRLRIITNKGLCKLCLQRCTNNYQCRARSRPCWYCKKIRETSFVDLLSYDEEEHHRAVCSIPEKKQDAEGYIRTLQAQLFEMLKARKSAEDDESARRECRK